MDFLNALVGAVADAADLVLAGSASTRRAGLELLEQAACDVLVVDLGLPDGSGIDVIRAAGLKWPACAVMVSTNFGDELHVMRSIEAGAAGYLLKHAEPAGLAEEIRSIHQGGSPISPLIARQMLTRFRHLSPAPAPAQGVADGAEPALRAQLSPREQEVLELITKGFTTDEIAALMGVSSHTVLTFIRRTYRKLKVNSRAEAIYEARAQGLLG
ncbi:two component transcriptional regulator, LuxR family [Rugamonas rubra]|uniref:Two component transcriptional regulator, LuxR family n=2 Tax=Rugamonas rubra TaxID=758825 RepID=A0A1I4ILR6_9BURK|nr:two component transcriptional regulator, LuxR family [Rugamonas rubra]